MKPGGGGILHYRNVSDYRNPPAPAGHPPLTRGALLCGSLPSYMAPPLVGELPAEPGEGGGKRRHPLRPLCGHLPHKGGGFFRS